MVQGRVGFGISLLERRAVEDLVGELGGEADPALSAAQVARIVEPESARNADDLALVVSPSRVPDVTAIPSVLLVARGIASRVPSGRRWIHERPLWVVARLLAPLEERHQWGIASEALVEAGAHVDPSAMIRPRAIVLAGARIGPGALIGEGAVIYGRTEIGARVVVGPNAVVGRPGFGFTTGPEGEPVRIPQLGGVIVEDDAEVGPLATVDAGTLRPTVIERGVKLDAHVHVGHNARLGAFTLVAAQSGFAGSTRVGRGVLVGGQVGVADHLNIGDGARLAAGSGVISDVPEGATVAGYPAVSKVSWLRAWARMLGGKKGFR